jgi:hypothetical protein
LPHRHHRLEDIPADRLMVETDSPYLKPRNLRPRVKSHRNEPRWLPWIVGTLAAVRDERPDFLAEQTTKNARRFSRTRNLKLSQKRRRVPVCRTRSRRPCALFGCSRQPEGPADRYPTPLGKPWVAHVTMVMTERYPLTLFRTINCREQLLSAQGVLSVSWKGLTDTSPATNSNRGRGPLLHWWLHHLRG